MNLLPGALVAMRDEEDHWEDVFRKGADVLPHEKMKFSDEHGLGLVLSHIKKKVGVWWPRQGRITTYNEDSCDRVVELRSPQ